MAQGEWEWRRGASTCFYTLSANPPTWAPPPCSLAEVLGPPVPALALCSQEALGVVPQQASHGPCPPGPPAQSPVLHGLCCFHLFPSLCFCVSGFQEERKLNTCAQFPSFSSKPILVLSPACSGDIFKPQMSDLIPELSRSCRWVWGEEENFSLLCVIYEHVHMQYTHEYKLSPAVHYASSTANVGWVFRISSRFLFCCPCNFLSFFPFFFLAF